MVCSLLWICAVIEGCKNHCLWFVINKHKLYLLQDGQNEHSGNEAQGFEELDCNINGEYTIGCRREGEEVYLPFSFLHKYFEVESTFGFAYKIFNSYKQPFFQDIKIY